jgi:hypothetical protein
MGVVERNDNRNQATYAVFVLSKTCIYYLTTGLSRHLKALPAVTLNTEFLFIGYEADKGARHPDSDGWAFTPGVNQNRDFELGTDTQYSTYNSQNMYDPHPTNL